MHRTPMFVLSAAMALVLTVVSCGSDDSNSSSPSAPSPTPTTIPSAGATITITSSGVSPKTVTVAAGSRVTFVNNDTRVHEMSSDPHPEHTECPEINQAGFLTVGQSRATGNLTTARTCSYHDHIQSTNTSLQGSIVVQ